MPVAEANNFQQPMDMETKWNTENEENVNPIEVSNEMKMEEVVEDKKEVVEDKKEAVEAETKNTIKLTSCDGETFELPKKAALLSRMVKRMLEDLGVEDDDIYTGPIILTRVEARILSLVVDWCRHHITDPPVVEIDNREKDTNDLPKWDVDFFAQMDKSTTFEVITAANFLDIYMLMDSGCKTVANMIKGKSVEQLREEFEIVNDFTPEEEARLRKEHTWVEDTNVPF